MKVKYINIGRTDAGGRYEEILDVLGFMSEVYGSAVNAAAQCILASPTYKRARKSMPKKFRSKVPKKPRKRRIEQGRK